jgi:DNA-dependent RNA polymerase auxiliary subunit epsilon
MEAGGDRVDFQARGGGDGAQTGVSVAHHRNGVRQDLGKKLSYHLEVSGLLSDNQFDFRKERGTTEAIDRAVGNLKRARAESKHATTAPTT